MRLEFEKGLAPERRLMSTAYLSEAPASASEPLVLRAYPTSALGFPTGPFTTFDRAAELAVAARTGYFHDL